ncbi:splicing factor, Prp19-binding domain-containing protein [Hygrophoropsis aurantiaca]|uniref:Splicing factor, Prp19-binding domain-containing protein n=1 Tax=Hygrophoropsis aurantiaca TaxID=72124 RepID=A0ACB8AS99_9AGAM|nr:splicing factor, Prp19-binding domain-containing protein [Hygrophoropsis aurantiaca]
MSTVLATEVRKHTAPRPARPTGRYWKGKAPKGAEEVDSDSDEEDAPVLEEDGDVLIAGDQDIADESDVDEPVKAEPGKSLKAMNVSLKDVNISKDGKVIVAGRDESGRTALEQDDEEDEEDEEEDDQKDIDEESESSESESESEEEKQPKLQFRPVFIPKRSRVTIAERDALVQDEEELQKQKELAAEERRKQSHDLVAESIRRELAEKEKDEIVPDVDDTDGLDPSTEFEAWRLRELGRIKKEKEEQLRIEQEREEVERRRALPEEQRLKEDMERANKLREEKPKGQQKFLQKYWHKGAFHQDEEILKRHDFTEATESTMDVSLLPQVMQVKNFGKRSRTKYTHLLDQDTTAGNGGFGGSGSVKTGGRSIDGGGCFLCGGPHLKKDCPQKPDETGRPLASGANTASTVSREWGHGRSWRDRGDEQGSDHRSAKEEKDNRSGYRRDDRYRNMDRESHKSQTRTSRSRSRSPPRDKWRDHHRPRDEHRYEDRRRARTGSQERNSSVYREKRRRLD